MEFIIYKDKTEKFRFRLIANNKKQILDSEGYMSKLGCKNGIDAVIKNASIKERYELKETSTGYYYFYLKAGNYQRITSSKYYKTKRGREMAIEIVMKIGDCIVINDLTLCK